MINIQRLYMSKNFSLSSKILCILIGSIIYGSVVIYGVLPRLFKQGAFAVAFVSFVGAFMSAESERISEEILNIHEDIQAQAQQDLLYDRNRPKEIKLPSSVYFSPDNDLFLPPWS